MIRAAILGCLLICRALCGAQTAELTVPSGQAIDRAEADYLTLREAPLVATLAVWFPPTFIHAGVSLKDFIRSGEFAALRRRHGDLKAVDALYIKAMRLASNNTSAALMISTVAVFDHYVVGIRNPVFSLFFPLSNESYEDYRARVHNLPRRLYSDTRTGGAGDRDKLQHFFGSACAALTLESGTIADRIGDFVEMGEEAAIVDGVYDSRDRRANWQGRQFGLALLRDPARMPSEFLVTPLADLGPALGRSGDGGCR